MQCNQQHGLFIEAVWH